jgi:hypothetical protein
MRDRSFIAAIAVVGILAALVLAAAVREADPPLHGPPNVDRDEVMSKVESGSLSFDEARFYAVEDEAGVDGAARGEGGHAEGGTREEKQN